MPFCLAQLPSLDVQQFRESSLSHTLTAKEQSLAKIFSDDYVFTIPGYQRPYAWGEGIRLD